MSKEPKWTPAPWWVEAETGDVVAKDGDWEICTFSRCDSHLEYDAHLIAAAPEMAALLLDILINYEAGEIVDREIETVLAKARGEA